MKFAATLLLAAVLLESLVTVEARIRRSSLRKLADDDDEGCVICDHRSDQFIGEKPTSLTLEYVGGEGSNSMYQDEWKATCRKGQSYPDTTTLTVKETGQSFEVEKGTVFTVEVDSS